MSLDIVEKNLMPFTRKKLANMNRYLRRENAEIETLMSGYRLKIWHLDDYVSFRDFGPLKLYHSYQLTFQAWSSLL